MAQNSYQTINLTADLTLSWPFSFTGGPTIADINNVNASLGPFKIILPDATLAAPGQNIIFNNISLNSFQIMANDGITSVVTIAAGEIYYLYLSNVLTANGNWIPIPFGGGTSAINSVTAQSSDNTIKITGGTVTPPGGTIDFQLPTSIANLMANITTPGFIVAKTASPSTLTFVTRDLIGGGNIIVNNPDGVSTDPIIELNPTGLSGIASIAVGDMTLSGSVITTSIVNGGIQLASAGTGKVSINGVEIDTSGNITGINNLTLNGSLNLTGTLVSPTTPKAIFTFTDTLVPLGNVVAIKSQFNVSTITGSGGVYTINFTNTIRDSFGSPSTNYGITLGLGSNGGTTPFVSHAFWTSKTPNSVSIVIVDASGVLVPDVENGITGVLWLPS